MLQALMSHSLRLLLLRHDGRGLPRSSSFTMALMVLSMIVCWVKVNVVPFGVPLFTEEELLLLECVVLLLFFPRVVLSGYLMISILWDTVLMLVFISTDDLATAQVLAFGEVVLLLALSYNVFRSTERNSK